MRTAALELATRFRVFPLWPVLPAIHADTFICGCGKGNCKSKGKHPLGPIVPHGVADATRDARIVDHWWKCRPDANIGIAAGDGLVVLDIDPRHGGDQSITELQRKYGRLPATLTSRTGGGGCHLFYEGDLPNSVGALGPGLDIRGDGGFVVAPPSVHVSGNRYAWHSQAPIAPVPDWLAGELGSQRKQSAMPDHWRAITSNDVTEGKRNDTVTRMTGHLLSRYVDPLVVLDLMQCWNACHCKPPLDGDEVTVIVNSICGREQRRGAA